MKTTSNNLSGEEDAFFRVVSSLSTDFGDVLESSSNDSNLPCSSAFVDSRVNLPSGEVRTKSIRSGLAKESKNVSSEGVISASKNSSESSSSIPKPKDMWVSLITVLGGIRIAFCIAAIVSGFHSTYNS